MRFLRIAAVASILPMAAPAQTIDQLSESTRRFVSVPETTVLLRGVDIIDGHATPPQRDMDILLNDGRIAAIGRSGSLNVPRGARVMDLDGHTVIPGIIGLHNHTFYTTNARRSQSNVAAPRLYLGSGVTTIRTTGSYHPYSEINLKSQIERGLAPGPRMHITGPYITGTGSGGYMTQVRNPEHARTIVRYWAEEGATWMKAYTGISRDELAAAIDEAHKHGMKFTGHLCSVTFREAVDAGIDNLEHGLLANTDFIENKTPDECPANAGATLGAVDPYSARAGESIQYLIDHDVPMTSTLAVYELFVPNRPPIEDRVLDAMAPEAQEDYLNARQQIAAAAETSTMPRSFRNAMGFEKRFYDEGGLLAAGVDPTGNGGALPGYGDQRNFELLVEAGFTPVQAIQVMSLNGAKVLGVDAELGSVETGKVADLVVIEGDIVANPAQIRNVRVVFKDGVGYSPDELVNSVQGIMGRN